MTDMGAIEVADTTAAEAFYRRLRGGQQAAGAGIAGGDDRLPRVHHVTCCVPAGHRQQPHRQRPRCRRNSAQAGGKVAGGYGGVVQAPDGTIWTVASSSKKDTGPADRQIDAIVLQLGVTDVAASKQFYLDRGLTAAESYGSRYVELDTGPIKLTLNKRGALAKTAGVSLDGIGSHRLVIGSNAGAFTDPDGFVWETPMD